MSQPTIESATRERIRIMREESGIEISPACEQIIIREVEPSETFIIRAINENI